MTMLLRALFVLAMGGCALLVGATLGGTVLGDMGGHGLARIGSVLEGAATGMVGGCVLGLVLVRRYQPGHRALLKGTGASLLGGCAVLLLMAWLDAQGYW